MQSTKVWLVFGIRSRSAATRTIVTMKQRVFFVGGDKQTAAELAQMKGQMVAIEQASIAKKCEIQFQGKPPGGNVAFGTHDAL